MATTTKIRVLIIDDSSTVRIAASRAFGNDFDVLLAVDGEDGLDVIENDTRIQVVFTDLVMPEMDGFELLKAIRTSDNEHIAQLPVIVMTGAENPELAKQKAFSLGATDFITKPFNATDIQARARSYAQFNEATKTLKAQTTLDSLTGLLNPKGFKQQLDKEIAFCSRHGYHLSILAVELDNYKDLFISMGRAPTEALIKRLARTLKSHLRKEDSLARNGLAGFNISIPLMNAESSLEIANAICQQVEAIKAKLNGSLLKLSVSVGIFNGVPPEEITPDQSLLMTQQALERAQTIGRGQFSLSNIDDYQHQYHSNGKDLSIDSLLERVNKGEVIEIADKLDMALEHLAPLLSLLSNEQKQRIFNYRR